jgi:hypothetical protein
MTIGPKIDVRSMSNGWESHILWPNGDVQVLPFKASTRAEALNQADRHIRAMFSLRER